MPDDLELDDIQGNVLAGFNTCVEVLLGLSADLSLTSEVATWLASLSSEVTSVAEVRRDRDAAKAPMRGEGPPITWLCVAIGPDLMRTVRPDVVFADLGFHQGFQARSRRVLEDRSDPTTWKVGGPANRPDVLLIVASNEESAAEERAEHLLASASAAGLACTYRETARRIQDLEHFGFRDGISQPKVRSSDVGGNHPPGHFVFGYERRNGESSYLPASGNALFLRNGSYLVFRRLAQDVGKFQEFCRSKAFEIQNAFPGITGEWLAALLVGRWPGGTLATMQSGSDPGRQPDDDAFDLTDDMLGAKCPLGAHIRKVNPRRGFRDVVDERRIMRRGIPFGPAYADEPDAERGLAFFSFQTSIKDQLEFLTADWMNSPGRPHATCGHDLLVGRARGPRALKLKAPGGDIEIRHEGEQWITPTGGGYFFAPGRAALARIADPVPRALGWRAARVTHGLRMFASGLIGR
jgi:Dyp-type peroxidase family